MGGTVRRKCNCKNEYQDKKYGPNVRVFNLTTNGARCTVCGTQVVFTHKTK